MEALVALRTWIDGVMRMFGLYSKLGEAKRAIADGDLEFGGFACRCARLSVARLMVL